MKENPATPKEDLIPVDGSELQWRHYAIIEKIGCAASEFAYEESITLEYIGGSPFTASSTFKYRCQVMMFSDNRLRFRYYYRPQELITGQFKNSSAEYVSKPDDDRLEFIDIRKSSGYKNEFRFSFDETFKGMSNYQVLLYSNETHFADKYNGWNFTHPELWDEFWYEPETDKLFETNKYVQWEQEV